MKQQRQDFCVCCGAPIQTYGLGMVCYECEHKPIEKRTQLYRIFADYRPKNKGVPYYVIAATKQEAKQRFKSIISWLDIHEVEQVDDEEAARIKANPEKYAIF